MCTIALYRTRQVTINTILLLSLLLSILGIPQQLLPLPLFILHNCNPPQPTVVRSCLLQSILRSVLPQYKSIYNPGGISVGSQVQTSGGPGHRSLFTDGHGTHAFDLIFYTTNTNNYTRTMCAPVCVRTSPASPCLLPPPEPSVRACIVYTRASAIERAGRIFLNINIRHIRTYTYTYTYNFSFFLIAYTPAL